MKKTASPAVPSPLDPLALSPKAKDFCRKAHIRTLRDLAARKGTDWRRIPGGKAVADELDRAVRKIASSRLLDREAPVRFLNDEGAVVRDFPLSTVLLSVRARRALETLGIKTMAQLAGWDATAIAGENLRNVGRVTVTELSRLVRARRVDGDAGAEDEARAAVLALFTPAKPAVAKAACEAALEAKGVAKARMAKVLQPLVAKGVLSIEKGTVSRAFPDINTFLDSLGNRSARNIKIVKGHLNGKTLDAVGRPLGLTRERVRQIYRLLFADVIRNARGRLAEDRFDAVFTGYEFTQAEFCAIFGEPVSTFRYLDATRAAGKGDPRDAASDARLDPAFREALRAYYAKKKPGRPAGQPVAEKKAPPAKPAAKPAAKKAPARKPVKKAKRG